MPVARLRIRPGGQDQSQLHRSDRLVNLVNRIWSPIPLSGKRVLLVDDVVTTGATLTEMARAVAVAGGEPIGFITVAETIPKSHTKSKKKV
jgi:predicted amidophosphoribosyltransferase